ncbi:MAG: starch-binding protein, partial [Ruminococcus sp.]|nr:starch-binding protein [Ruminococcus sp.]
MTKTRKLLAIFLTIATILSIASVSAFSASTESVGITVHYYSESGTPNIYYWNALPTNIQTEYPGPTMVSEGNGWYKYTFSDKTKINLMFVTQGNQSNELTRTTGEWWYKGTRWYSKDPSNQGNY